MRWSHYSVFSSGWMLSAAWYSRDNLYVCGFAWLLSIMFFVSGLFDIRAEQPRFNFGDSLLFHNPRYGLDGDQRVMLTRDEWEAQLRGEP